MTVLVTGATGFLGDNLLDLIKINNKEKFVFLVREKSAAQLKKKIEGFDHLRLVIGGLTHPDVFLDDRDYKELIKEIDTVVHLAALYDLGGDSNELYKTNVIGTQNILFFASQCPRVKKVIYASTIAVSGDFKGTFGEDDFDLGQGFPNAYAKTKFEAESVVRKYSYDYKDVEVSILRFGIIVGDSVEGKITKEDGPYFFFKNITKLFNQIPQVKKLPFVPFPFKSKAYFPLIPVDFCAEVVNLLLHNEIKNNPKSLKVYHIISDGQPLLEDFLKDFLTSLGMEMRVFGIPRVPMLEKSLKAFSIPPAIMDYLYLPTSFVNINWDIEFSSKLKRPIYDSYKPQLFSYVKDKYLRKNGESI